MKGDPIEWLDTTLAGGHVKRFHTTKTIGTQTVGEHTFGVALLVIALQNGQPSNELLKAALFHDLAEQAIGDTPAPTKWRYSAVKEGLAAAEAAFNEAYGLHTVLSENERLCLKWADMLELLYYVLDQLKYGNGHAALIFNNGCEYLGNLKPHPVGLEILVHLKNQRDLL